MTRLPTESWDVKPRLDLGTYELNTVCPITGGTLDLEDHHIFRRSFTALGKEENEKLFWVEVDGVVVPNRIALETTAHQRITTNVGRLEFRGPELWYIEKGEERKLDLRLHMMAGDEKIAAPRKKKEPTEAKRPRQVYAVRAPVDAGENGIEVLETLVNAAREKYAPVLGWKSNVPAYNVIVAVLAKDLQEVYQG